MSDRLPIMWWIHSQRLRHDRFMAGALSKVEWAQALERQGDFVKASIHLHEVAKLLARCGCPRRLWPEKVQRAVEVSDE